MSQAPNEETSAYAWFILEFSRHITRCKDLMSRGYTWEVQDILQKELERIMSEARSKGLTEFALSTAKQEVLTNLKVATKRG
jgi:hypothetical protein